MRLSKQKTGWDRAIWDTKREIQKLEMALRVFEQNKKTGEPWPGTEHPNRKRKEQQANA